MSAYGRGYGYGSGMRGLFDGIAIIVRTAEEQKRTRCDVPTGRWLWTKPGRVPSKARGRKGTRRQWKLAHAPRLYQVMRYREPESALISDDGAKVIVTPAQHAAIVREVNSLPAIDGDLYGW